MGETKARLPLPALGSKGSLVSELDKHEMAPSEGIEPPTPSLGRRRSIH